MKEPNKLAAPEDLEAWRAYFLGRLDENERAKIETLFLTDERARNTVLAAQEDLIEAYLDGSLTEADREEFEARYAATPNQQRTLRIRKSIQEWALDESESGGGRQTK